ncbi:MAG: hypothetical protein Q4B32_08005 [Clostridia bacterium]|nr:hypothetical protein [Clostridia bacterium]
MKINKKADGKRQINKEEDGNKQKHLGGSAEKQRNGKRNKPGNNTGEGKKGNTGREDGEKTDNPNPEGCGVKGNDERQRKPEATDDGQGEKSEAVGDGTEDFHGETSLLDRKKKEWGNRRGSRKRGKDGRKGNGAPCKPILQ